MRMPAILMAMAACSSETGASSAAQNSCTAPSGVYDYTFFAASTNDPMECPLPQPFETVLPASTRALSGCDLSVSNTSQTACSASAQDSCSVTSPAGDQGVLTAIVTADSNADGSVITGSVKTKFVYASGQGQCQAQWGYTAKRVHA